MSRRSRTRAERLALLQPADGGGHLLRRPLREGVELQIADAVAHLGGERDVAQPHNLARQRERELRLGRAVATHRERDRRPRLAAQPVLHLRHRQPLGVDAVDRQNDVARPHAGVVRETFDRAEHDGLVAVAADREADAAVPPLGAHREVLRLHRVLVARVRVERAEHRVDARLEELVDVNVAVDVRRLHVLEDRPEEHRPLEHVAPTLLGQVLAERRPARRHRAAEPNTASANPERICAGRASPRRSRSHGPIWSSGSRGSRSGRAAATAAARRRPWAWAWPRRRRRRRPTGIAAAAAPASCAWTQSRDGSPTGLKPSPWVGRRARGGRPIRARARCVRGTREPGVWHRVRAHLGRVAEKLRRRCREGSAER